MPTLSPRHCPLKHWTGIMPWLIHSQGSGVRIRGDIGIYPKCPCSPAAECKMCYLCLSVCLFVCVVYGRPLAWERRQLLPQRGVRGPWERRCKLLHFSRVLSLWQAPAHAARSAHACLHVRITQHIWLILQASPGGGKSFWNWMALTFRCLKLVYKIQT